MLRNALLASALAFATACPVLAQDAAGTMTATQAGVSPLMGTSATDYVKLAADADMYEIQSSKVALTRSKRADVKSFARQMIADHTTTTKALMASRPLVTTRRPSD